MRTISPLKTLCIAAAAAALSGPALAATTTYTFDDLTPTTVGAAEPFEFHRDGFRMTSEGGLFVLGQATFFSMKSADPTGRTLAPVGTLFNGIPDLILRRDDPYAAFDLVSIDLADLRNNGSTTRLELTGYRLQDDGYTNVEEFQTLSLDALAGLQTVALNWQDITLFRMRSLNSSSSNFTVGNFQLDNLTLSVADPAPPVPEPGEWAMLVAGLGIVGAAARRRRTPRA